MRVGQWLIVIVLSMGRPEPVRIRVNPRVIMSGQTLTITCTVERDARNRQLDYGIVDYTTSSRGLEGEAAPKTWGPYFYSHIGCEMETAFCSVTRNDGSRVQAVMTFEVGGCDGH